MKAFLIRLYPARWRARYGEEFAAVLDERPLGPFDVVDILLGAVDAQLRLRGGVTRTHGEGVSMSLRIGGIAAIVGPLLWVVALTLSNGLLIEVDPALPTALLFAGIIALLVALAGLSAFQARAHPRLVWASFAIPTAGVIVCVAGIVGTSLFGDRPIVAGLSSWYLFFFGMVTAFVGSGLFAVATWRTGVLSRPAALLLGIGSVLPLVSIVIPNIEFMIVAGIGLYVLGWSGLGIQAIRLDGPARTMARSA